MTHWPPSNNHVNFAKKPRSGSYQTSLALSPKTQVLHDSIPLCPVHSSCMTGKQRKKLSLSSSPAQNCAITSCLAQIGCSPRIVCSVQRILADAWLMSPGSTSVPSFPWRIPAPRSCRAQWVRATCSSITCIPRVGSYGGKLLHQIHKRVKFVIFLYHCDHHLIQ
jgi:hypothetical protein